MALQDPPARFTTWKPASTPPRSAASASWSATTPASPSSPTRPSSARMPLPTRPASTRTACSRTSRPTRSCAPRTSASASRKLVLGKHSGRHALQAAPGRAGLRPGRGRAGQGLCSASRHWPTRKKVITDADLEALIADELYQPREMFTLDGLQVACGTMGMPTATVRLRGPDGKIHIQASHRHRPGGCRLQGHRRHRQGSQHPAGIRHPRRHRRHRRPGRSDRAHPGQGWPALQWMPRRKSNQPRTFGGHGADTDIIVASAKAYLAALNKLLVAQTEASTSPAEMDHGRTDDRQCKPSSKENHA